MDDRFLLVRIFFSGAVEGRKDKGLQQSTPTVGTKRRKDSDGNQNSKAAKAIGDVSSSRSASTKNHNELESKLEAQSKELWTLKDSLKKHVTTAELRQMLEANDQDSSGSELDLRDKW